MTTASRSERPIRRSPVSRIASALLGIGLAVASTVSAFAANPVQKVKSPSGIEAWLIESHEVGLISMRFMFEGGSLSEPADKLGVAQMFAFMFNEGAGTLDSEALSSRRMALGVNFGGWADWTALGVNFTTPSANKAEAFELLRLAIHQPRYDADPIERARREYAANLAAERTQPSSIASDILNRRQFGSHRLALSSYGTPETLKSITREDIEAYRKRMFARSTLKVAVAGDITPAELAPLLDNLFGALPVQSDVAPWPTTPPQTASADVSRMDVPQTLVMMSSASPKLDWRQSLAFSLANQVLSATSTGRLFKEIREKRGLVYAIQSQRYETANTSTFIAAFGAGGENVKTALEETRREIARFLKEGMTEAELADVKEAFVGSFFLGIDTNDKLVNALLSMLRFNLPVTYFDDYAAEVAKITSADAMAVVRQVIRPETMNIVVVGNPPADFKVEVAAVGP